MLLLSVGPDLPWLTGYEAMPLERLTMLVLPRDGDATLVVPRLEAPRVVERPDLFAHRARGTRPTTRSRVVAGLVGRADDGRPSATAPGPRSSSTSRTRCPAPSFAQGERRHRPAPGGEGRGRDRRAAPRPRAAADRVAAAAAGGEIPLVGRTEAEVSPDLGRAARWPRATTA